MFADIEEADFNVLIEELFGSIVKFMDSIASVVGIQNFRTIKTV